MLALFCYIQLLTLLARPGVRHVVHPPKQVGSNIQMGDMLSNAWIMCPRSNQRARLRLFCFPYAGGAASVFNMWPDNLPPDVEVCPVQFPGREGRLREAPFTQLKPLVLALAQAIRPHLDKPFAFFGHSLGAMVGFELARQLRGENGPAPLHLFVSGSPAPQLPRRRSAIHQLPEKEFIKELALINGTPAAVLHNVELMQLFLPILRADFAMHETYRYAAGEPLDCSLSAFGGLADSEVSRQDSEAWRDQTRGAFKLRMLPGDHFFLRSARTLLLQAISQDLIQLLAKSLSQN